MFLDKIHLKVKLGIVKRLGLGLGLGLGTGDGKWEMGNRKYPQSQEMTV